MQPCDAAVGAGRRIGMAGMVSFAVLLFLPACAAQQTPLAASAHGPMNTGTYPNLNVRPDVAAPEISADEKTRLESEIGAAKAAQAPRGRAPLPPQEAERIRNLASTHADDTLKAIADE